MLIEPNSTLTEFYKGWENYQQLLLKTITPLTEEQLELQAAANLRSVRDIAQHLIAVRVRWFHDAAGAGSEEVAPIGMWDRPGERPRTTAELVTGLETSWTLIHDALSKWTQAELEQPFTVQYHGEQHTLVRKWIIWHVIEHDLNHGGELFLTLGMHGLPTPDV